MSNILAESLLLMLKQKEVELENFKKAQEEEYRKEFSKLVRIKKQMQEVCTHPTTREEDATDYHNNVEWTKVYCTVCGNFLKRY